VTDFDKGVELNPSYPYIYNDRGAAYAHKHENDRAIQDYDQAIRLDPNNALAFINQGIAYRYPFALRLVK
jgi:lipoprotein NlpI